jgi:outer membrane lipoprotein SlyB
MRTRMIIMSTIAIIVASFAPTAPANAVGCISGGFMGAVAGHQVGHGILGALGGCVAGHQWHKHQLQQQDLANRQAYVAKRKQLDPNYQDPWANSN